MRVLLVTTWETDCGIAEHAAYLKAAMPPEVVLVPVPEALDPAQLVLNGAEVVHLNYHAALHSRWQPETITRLKATGVKVVVTYHDSGVPNSDQCKQICAAADWFVVHEPYEDLPAHGEYLRMGVPAWTAPLDRHVGDHKGRPVLGSIGFPFPWKCYDQLAEVTAQAGWGLLLIAPNATTTDLARWRKINPETTAIRSFVPRTHALQHLGSCDATAFTYVCHNTGQSGALLQGIAARKPVIALETCRQFRALRMDPLGAEAIRWAETFEGVAKELRHVPVQRVDPGIVALAEQESWARVGKRYAEIYAEVVR